MLLVVGAVHVPIAPEHLREAPYVGVLFIALAVSCVGMALLLLWRESPAVWRLTATVAAMAAFAYLLSRTVGLPEIGDEIGHWSDPLGVIALAAEAATVCVPKMSSVLVAIPN